MNPDDTFQDLVDRSKDLILPYDDAWVKQHHEFAARNWPTKNRRRSEQYVRWSFRGMQAVK